MNLRPMVRKIIRRPLIIGVLGLSIGLVTTAGCARRIHLKMPDTTPSSSYDCRSGRQCAPNPVDVLRRTNQPRTAQIMGPRECAGRVAEVFIEDADSSSPTVIVTCATRESSVHDME